MKRLLALMLVIAMLLGMAPSVMAAGNPFKDVADGAWYAEAVLWAVDEGITNGYGSDDIFAPDLPCSRSQVVTFLWRAAGSPKPSADAVPFRDVPANAWYKDAVLWAVEQNITAGTGDGTTFSPDMKCSRAQVVTFLQRFQNEMPSSSSNPFKDVPADAWYTNAVLWAVEKGITQGTGDGTNFSPDMECSRAQIGTFLYRCIGKNTPTPKPDGKPLLITMQPVDVVSSVGDIVELTVKAEGGVGALSYRWEYSINDDEFLPAVLGTYFKGYTTDTLTFTVESGDFTLYDSWRYRCVITDEAGTVVTSNVVSMTKMPDLIIATQPENAYLEEGEIAEFEVKLESGTAPYSYQWQESIDGGKNFNDLGPGIWGCQGYNTYCLGIDVQSIVYGNLYRCVIKDSNGKTVTSNTVGIYEPFLFTTQPKDIKGYTGSKVSFTVAAFGGAGDYSYQWQIKLPEEQNYVNASNVSSLNLTGTRTPTLTIEITNTDISGAMLRCVISDSSGDSHTSNSAKLTAAEKFTVTFQDKDYWNTDGELNKDQHELIAKASGGSGNYTYTWYRKSVPVGSNASDYSFSMLSETSSRMYCSSQRGRYIVYKCVVSDGESQPIEREFWLQHPAS